MPKLDSKIIVLIVACILIILCIVFSKKKDRNMHVPLISSEIDLTTLPSDVSDAPDIIIDEETYQKMLDAVTNYSLMTKDYDRKRIIIYLSTFHLFDMNYSYKPIQKLDNSLVDYPYISSELEYPVGDLYRNLQKAIITHITKNIDMSEKVLSNDRRNDRMIIDIYLRNLFVSIGAMKIKSSDKTKD